MRHLLAILLWAGASCGALAAEGWFRNPFHTTAHTTAAHTVAGASYGGPNCVTPVPPGCGVPGHPLHCQCRACDRPCRDVPCQDVPCIPDVPKDVPPPTKDVPPQLEYLPKEQGAYVAPPRVGATRGALVQRGVETGAITFPEFKLKFPCIELPACFVSRSQARMHVESGIAPWESHGVVNAAAGTNEALLLRRIAELEKSMAEKESPPAKTSDSPADQAQREKAAAEDYARKLAEYQRLLEQCEKQQEELRACIRECLEQHSSPKQSPIQQPQRGPQQAPAEVYGEKPEVDPSAFVRPPLYPERPASHITEPARLSGQHWIREPAAPAGRITGLRPAPR